MILERQHELLTRQEVTDIINDGQLLLHVRAVAPPKTPLAVCFYQLKLQVRDQDGQALASDDFISAARLYDLTQEVDRWIIGQILTQRAPDIARKGLSIALPLTTDSLLDASFQDDLLAALDASPCNQEHCCWRSMMRWCWSTPVFAGRSSISCSNGAAS